MSSGSAEPRVVELRLVEPSGWQRRLDAAIRAPGTRVVVCVLGRKAGKTTSVQRILRWAVQRRLNIGWYAHVKKAARQAYDYLTTVPYAPWANEPPLPQALVTYQNESDLRLRLFNGSSFVFGSMETPDNNRGATHDVVVLDEGAQMSSYARDTVAASMLAQSSVGVMIVFTTPKGRRGRGGWVFRDYKKAEAGTPGYVKIHGRTEDNPLPAVQEWAAWARKNLPDSVVKQEIDAEFLDSGLGVIDFRRVAVNGGNEREPLGMPYEEEPLVKGFDGRMVREPCSVGFDPARTRDYFSCAAVGHVSRRLRGLARFQGMEWRAQVQIAAGFWRRFSGGEAARIDGTGIGDAVAAMMREEHVPVIPINFGKKAERGDQRFEVDNKTAIIQGLQVATENREWSCPWIEELVSEGDTFEMELLPSGRVRYQAAEGFHDDLVSAAGLALLGLPMAGHTGVSYGLVVPQHIESTGRQPADEDIQDDDSGGGGIMQQEF